MFRIGPVGESSDTMESILHVGVYEISIRLKGGGPREKMDGSPRLHQRRCKGNSSRTCCIKK